jgi:hypothetical protein
MAPHTFLTSAVDGIEFPASCLGCFTAIIILTGGQIGRRVSLDTVKNESTSFMSRIKPSFSSFLAHNLVTVC